MIKILVADDHQLVREGFKVLLSLNSDFKVIADAGDGMTAVELVKKFQPDVLMLDLGLTHMNGLEVIRIVRSNSKTQVVVVTAHDDDPHITEALAAGACGYVLKNDCATELTRAIKSAATGTPFVSMSIRKTALAAAIGSHHRPEDPYNDLTDREREILRLAAEGLTNGEVGQKLFISARTVESHRANMMKKLNLRTQTDIVRFAVRRKIITP